MRPGVSYMSTELLNDSLILMKSKGVISPIHRTAYKSLAPSIPTFSYRTKTLKLKFF
jgi:hypothetical protein